MTTVLSNDVDLFQQSNTPCHTTKTLQESFEEQFKMVVLATDWASVECGGQTSLIHGCPTSQLAGSAVKIP